MFTSGTVEEVIYQRQLQKGNLATLTVDGVCGKPSRGSSKETSFTKEELNDCFTLKECDCNTKRKVGSHWKAYDGSDSLRSQNCEDLPLIDVADSDATTLRYVRIVDDTDGDECMESRGDWEAAPPSLYDSDNEEEVEFSMSDEDEKVTPCKDDDEEFEF